MVGIVPGTYIALNALTATYLNLLSFKPAPAQIVCSVGNHLGNDYWNVYPTEFNSTIIQNYGNGDFLSIINFDQSYDVVSSDNVHSWNLISTSTPYGFFIQDPVTLQVLAVEDNSKENGANVVLETQVNSESATSQVWFFVSTISPNAGVA